uniref:Aminotransferase-like plant mobile domain-containing protein n=1 Tax=Fagus sylvatica TaxID=28930 RepID=A0A2N9J7J2_FAGSY
MWAIALNEEGKVVAYAPDSLPNTDEEYDAMEISNERTDRQVAENLQRFFDAESDDGADDFSPTPSPGIVIGETTRTTSKRTRVTRVPPPASTQDLELVWPGVPQLAGSKRGGWFWSFPQHSIHVTESSLALFWVYALGVRVPPSDRISGREALAILGLNYLAACYGFTNVYLRVRYLKEVLEGELQEPPTDLRYSQWMAYFIFNCFLGDDQSTIPTLIFGMFKDIDTMKEYAWGALTYV